MIERVKVLCVDDEPNVLEGLKLNLRRRFEVSTATSGPDGLEIIRTQGPFAAVISDMRMPAMDGAAFLARVRELAPQTVRMLLTGQTDIEAAISAVNEGQIFRFLSKPCPPERVLAAAEAAAEYHRLVTAERVLLEKTLHGCINALTEILSLAQPAAFGRAVRVKRLVSELASRLGIEERWPIEVAAMLSQVGCITLPPETVEKLYRSAALETTEQASVDRLPALAARLIADIPRMEPVRQILTEQGPHSTGAVEPGDVRRPVTLSLGARLLRIALDYDALQCRGLPPSVALGTLRGRMPAYDPAALEALTGLIGGAESECEVLELRVSGLHAGMILAEEVRMRSGGLLVARGQEVTESLIERLRNFSAGNGINEPLRVIARTVPVLQ